MGCFLHCKQTGACCDNDSVLLVCSWTNTLMALMNENPDIHIDEAIKRCSKAHYDSIGMDNILKPLLENRMHFINFCRIHGNGLSLSIRMGNV